jgi:citrate synthase
MAIMAGVVGALSAFEKNIDVNNPLNREYVCIRLIAKMPTLAAISFRTARGLPVVYPRKDFNFI